MGQKTTQLNSLSWRNCQNNKQLKKKRNVRGTKGLFFRQSEVGQSLWVELQEDNIRTSCTMGGKAKDKGSKGCCAIGEKDCLRPKGTVVWVFCEACEGWYHCPCVNVDSKKA